MKPTDKIALITGASRGLGRNTAMSLARNGTDVILTYHSNQKEAETAVAGIVALGRKAVAFKLDTGNVNAFGDFAKQVRQSLSEICGRTVLIFLSTTQAPHTMPHLTRRPKRSWTASTTCTSR